MMAKYKFIQYIILLNIIIIFFLSLDLFSQDSYCKSINTKYLTYDECIEEVKAEQMIPGEQFYKLTKENDISFRLHKIVPFDLNDYVFYEPKSAIKNRFFLVKGFYDENKELIQIDDINQIENYKEDSIFVYASFDKNDNPIYFEVFTFKYRIIPFEYKIEDRVDKKLKSTFFKSMPILYIEYKTENDKLVEKRLYNLRADDWQRFGKIKAEPVRVSKLDRDDENAPRPKEWTRFVYEYDDNGKIKAVKYYKISIYKEKDDENKDLEDYASLISVDRYNMLGSETIHRIEDAKEIPIFEEIFNGDKLIRWNRFRAGSSEINTYAEYEYTDNANKY